MPSFESEPVPAPDREHLPVLGDPALGIDAEYRGPRGGSPIVKVTVAVDALSAGLPLSKAVACTVWLPAVSPVALKAKGAVVAVLTNVPSTRNSTRTTAPPGSLAVADERYRWTGCECLASSRTRETHCRWRVRGAAAAHRERHSRCRRTQRRGAVIKGRRLNCVVPGSESGRIEGVGSGSSGANQRAVDAEFNANHRAAWIAGGSSERHRRAGRESLAGSRTRETHGGRCVRRVAAPPALQVVPLSVNESAALFVPLHVCVQTDTRMSHRWRCSDSTAHCSPRSSEHPTVRPRRATRSVESVHLGRKQQRPAVGDGRSGVCDVDVGAKAGAAFPSLRISYLTACGLRLGIRGCETCQEQSREKPARNTRRRCSS